MAAEEESAVGYLERHIFPILLPGLEETLNVAVETEKRKRFNSLDYLVEYLYKHNPKQSGREEITFETIPFVQEEWKNNPRPSLPLSATLTEDEASIIIQSAYRGYKTSCRIDVQLYRQWEKGFKRELEAIILIQRTWRHYYYQKKQDTLINEEEVNKNDKSD